MCLARAVSPSQVVLQNVVVAVLLDKFTSEPEEEEEDEEEESLPPASASPAVGAPASSSENAPSVAPLNVIPPEDAANVAALQADFARIAEEQAMVKQQIGAILSRLQKHKAIGASDATLAA